MRPHFALSFAFALGFALLMASTANAQTPAGKTPDGQPDMQGVWLFFDNTPFETPGGPPRRRQGESLESTLAAEKAQAEAAARRERERAAAAAKGEAPAQRAPAGGGSPFYTDRGPVSARRASMVIDPADGKIPIRPQKVKENNELQDRFYESYKYMNINERCITRGVPAVQFPAQNASVQIIQGPGTVALVYESLHFARIIPLNGGPHLHSNIHLWTGDSRGRWEDNTLVVETTNYNNQGSITPSADGGYLQGHRYSEQLKIVERFTFADNKTINWEVTIDDPLTYLRPWKAALSMARDDGSYKAFEYACHEGNYRYMTNTLRAGRVMDGTITIPPSPTRQMAEESLKSK